MLVPTWVPKPIQDYVLAVLDGDGREPAGLRHAWETSKKTGDLAASNDIGADIGFLNRLIGVDDERMKEAYEILQADFVSEPQWRGFAAAAWSARMNYGSHRSRIRRSRELAVEIADAADDLVRLLEEAGRQYDNWPGELFSIRELLSSTNGRDPLWPGLRQHIMDDSVNPQFENMLLYIWSIAPSVPEMLMVLAKTSRNFSPFEQGVIGAAIGNRQSNPKTEYIRAIGQALKDRNFAFTDGLMRAVAIVTNVALNGKEIDVSVKDVRQALAHSGITGDR